jgi:heptosyltransferase-2
MSDNVLIGGANWVGDTIMSMPAIRLFRAANPSVCLTVLTRPALRPLWEMQPAVDQVMESSADLRGTFSAVAAVRARVFRQAYIFPNSFRSAWIPFSAGVPGRRGFRGHWRAWLLTDIAVVPAAALHQSWEYLSILDIHPRGEDLPVPGLVIPPSLDANVRGEFGLSDKSPCLAVLPGAARGPSKRWPARHFGEAARRIRAATGWPVLVLGTVLERDLCREVVDFVGPGARSLAGEVDLAGTAAVLRLARVAITNDSGGMHLAAAVGTPVVAVYGLTDPAVTGPLGQGHRVISRPGVVRSREIRRDSAAAVACLESIHPEEVAAAALETIERPVAGGRP